VPEIQCGIKSDLEGTGQERQDARSHWDFAPALLATGEFKILLPLVDSVLWGESDA